MCVAKLRRNRLQRKAAGMMHEKMLKKSPSKDKRTLSYFAFYCLMLLALMQTSMCPHPYPKKSSLSLLSVKRHLSPFQITNLD